MGHTQHNIVAILSEESASLARARALLSLGSSRIRSVIIFHLRTTRATTDPQARGRAVSCGVHYRSSAQFFLSVNRRCCRASKVAENFARVRGAPARLK